MDRSMGVTSHLRLKVLGRYGQWVDAKVGSAAQIEAED